MSFFESAVILVILPFAVLVLAIFIIRIMRSSRQYHEIRGQGPVATAMPEMRTPSDDYHDKTWLPLCDRLAEAAVAELGRPLTERERRAIWRSRSALLLDVLIKEVQEKPDAGAVASLLRDLPPGMDRPDPTQWCRIA